MWQRTYTYRLFAVFIDSSRVELRINPIASVAKTSQVKPRWVQKYQIYWRLRTIVALQGAGHNVPRVSTQSMFKHSPHNRLSTMEHQEPLVRNESAPSLHLSHSLTTYLNIHIYMLYIVHIDSCTWTSERAPTTASLSNNIQIYIEYYNISFISAPPINTVHN